MKKMSACIMLGLTLLISKNALAGDALGSVFEQSLIPSKLVILYDQCVKQGYIEDSGSSAEQKLRNHFDRSRGQDDAYKNNGVTGDQAADAAEKALDTLKTKMTEHPLPLDQAKCDSLKQTWPKFAQQYGLQ